MKNAYLAICYICNENCKFCPCAKNEKATRMITDIVELKITIHEMKKQGITDVTISGGEPTMHPAFLELIQYIQKQGMMITILSNAETFSNRDFLDAFLKGIDVSGIKIITTLHSHSEKGHEIANQTKGSFKRTLDGLHNLIKNNVRIIIKHCITKRNYKDLKEFYLFCDNIFPPCVDIQLCSIDYCGIPESELEQEKISFLEIKPYLESLFEHYENQKKRTRNIYCINMPLCTCDVVYWRYMPFRREKMYNSYKDPHSNQIREVDDNVGTDLEICGKCKVRKFCTGTYYTAYKVCGSDLVAPILK